MKTERYKRTLIKHRNSRIIEGKQVKHYKNNSVFEYIIEETEQELIISASIKYPIRHKKDVYEKIEKTGYLPLLKELKDIKKSDE